jgi:diaminopimelate decarboxylase
MNAFDTLDILPGHPWIAYRDGHLYLEDRRLDDLAQRHGTPLFVYAQSAIEAAVHSYQRGLIHRSAGGRVCYAMKANSAMAILQVFARLGCGFDIVSGGDLARVQAAGANMSQVVFSGVGKTPEEMKQALQAGIGCFNVESLAELEVLAQVAQEMGLRAPVSLRINPHIDAQTHPYISTGLRDNKFGIAHQDALQAYQRAASLPSLNIVGIDCHIGSQITQLGPYMAAVDRLIEWVIAIEKSGIHLQHVDIGGGLGISYQNETPPQPEELVCAVGQRLDAAGLGDKALWIEPGRSLIGNAGLALSQVLYLKPGDTKNFCIIDAAMNDLPRPALYDAFHQIVPLIRPVAHTLKTRWDVVGPVCESGDWLGRDRELAIQAGDHLAVLSCGAYCMSMASNYNSRGRAAEVLVKGDQAVLIRRRETWADQLQCEILLPICPPLTTEYSNTQVPEHLST